MKLIDLFEMPLGRFDTKHYDPEVHGKVVQRTGVERYEQKMKNQFKGAKEVIDIQFIPEVDFVGDDVGEWGEIKSGQQLQLLNKNIKDWGVTVTVNPRAITLLVAGANYSDAFAEEDGNELPMTPWMLGHRLSHALMDAEIRLNNSHLKEVLRPIGDILHKSGQKGVKDSFLGSAYHEIGAIEDELLKMSTMRSARRDNMNNEELLIELFTQFIMSGTVKLKDIGRNTVVPITNVLNGYFSKVLKQSVGRVFLTR